MKALYFKVFLVVLLGHKTLFADESVECKFNPERMFEVSIINLIADPKKYHNSYIRVTGVVNFEYEGDALYLNKESQEHRIKSNSIYLDVSENIRNHIGDIQDLSGTYQLIEGTFISSGESSGYITEICRISFHFDSFYRQKK